jgi:hypothetical protein
MPGWSAAIVNAEPILRLPVLSQVPSLGRLASALLVSSVLVTATGHASERWATLEAIHQLENPHNSPEPGPCGELGAYQFREATWRMYTNAPFSRALDRRISDTVAVKHYNWIRGELERRGVAPSPYMIALAWNAGVNAAVDDNPPSTSADYATRAANIVAELQGRQLADSR